MTNPGSNSIANATVVDNLDVLKDILEFAPINIMIADANENIIFVNKRSRDILQNVEGELAKYLPGFSANQVLGGSIHRYHKDPGAIKRILHGLQPGMTRKGEIAPGHFVFEHETRVLVDRAGQRLGYVVQWHDVTEKRQKEEQAQRLQTAVDGAQLAMMTINRELIVTYANEETKKLMKKNADVLSGLYRGFDATKLLGTCIDIFHKNPAHQRRLLEDARNLPFETDIQVGPLTFHIRASAIHNLAGQYVGNTLEWNDVTELRRREVDVKRLQSAIDGSKTALMLCDKDLKITFANPAVVDLLRHRQNQLSKLFPGFDPNKLLGVCIDGFHKNPAHQRALLSNTARLPYEGHIELPGMEFVVNATAILDGQGNYMGNMVEWQDVTEQKDAERRVQELIDAAIKGQLDKRIESERYQGFLKKIGEGINHLIDAVVQPLKDGTQVMQSLAEGDLTNTMDGHYEGDYATLRDALNKSVENLVNMVGQIRNSSSSITAGSSEIAQGNADLSQRTEQQASSLEETASSMEELTSTVKQNADNARQANQLAAGARGQADKGQEVVRNAITAMSEISGASKKIAEIIGVIDEIAFQTNLLALNAAVEAARAGEQGRGFAVVAAEVRNLAQRSAGAAKEIKNLIKDSVDKVSEGQKLVDASGKTLDEIVIAVKKVSDIIAEIAAASQEQSAGIEQINKAITQLDEVTQQNAALVEEAAAASESMEDQAQNLQQMIAFFKVDEQQNNSQNMAHDPAVRGKRDATRPASRAPRQPTAATPRSSTNGGDDEWR
ncbi:MAG: methyl-accepting chemotaxis protein [Pseudomonadota bacterium]